MRAITFLLAIFLAVVPSMPVFAADEEPEPSLGENESYITLPLGYNAEQNTYYFSDIEQYCGQYAPNTDAPTAGVSWYSGSYPDEDARLVGGPSIFDCTEQNTIDLNGVEGHSPTLDGERTIVIDNGEHRYILKYSVEDDVLTSAGSPPFSLDAPFTPVRDDEGEHRLLSATVENNILKLDQSSCDLLLSGVGGRLSHPDELWAFDKAIWMAFKEPAESGAYDADHWPSIADSRNLYPMVDDGNPETMGTPVCYGDGVPELPYYLNYWDLEDPHYYTPTDGTLKFFVWAATHNRPGFNGQPLRSNAKPIGYVSVTRVDGTWYLTGEEPPKQMLKFSISLPTSLSIYDEFGNRSGYLEDGSFEEGILGSSYGENVDGAYILVPAGHPYLVLIEGENEGLFNFKIEEIVGETIIRTSAIQQVPITIDTLATFWITNNVEDASLLDIDENNDEIIDLSIAFVPGENFVHGGDVELTESEEEISAPAIEDSPSSYGYSKPAVKVMPAPILTFPIQLPEIQMEIIPEAPFEEADEPNISVAPAVEEVEIKIEIPAPIEQKTQTASAYNALPKQSWLGRFIGWVKGIFF